MSQIRKHNFEAISLLTAANGMLDVTIVPAMNQPDWIIPTDLILSVEPYQDRIWTYLWRDQEVAVFHLIAHEQTPDKLVVLEGNTTVHRLALQTAGELRHLKVNISDVKDTPLPERYANLAGNYVSESATIDDAEGAQQPVRGERFREDTIVSYLFQTVIIDTVPYLVPDLEKIAHQLVDLDS